MLQEYAGPAATSSSPNTYAPMVQESTLWLPEDRPPGKVGTLAEKVTGYYTRCMQRHVVVPNDRILWLKLWDIVIVLILFLVAYYEPFAVSLLKDMREPGVFVAFNNVIDMVFTVDMALQFVIAHPCPADGPSVELWEQDPCQLAKRYCGVPFSHDGQGGWFWLDLLSVLPGWFSRCRGRSHENANPLVAVRFFRLLRMLRLVRFKKYVVHWHILHGFRYYLVDCGKFFIITTLTCHWMACIWCLVEAKITGGAFGFYRTNHETWLSALITAKGDMCEPDAAHDPGCVYLLALYWATMTLTSVGYGDIVAQNRVEYCTVVVCMLIVGYVWAYVVGMIVSILSSIDPHEVEYQQDIDELNDLMMNRNLPRELQIRLRSYMHASRKVQRLRAQRRLLERSISHGLQREVARHSGETACILKGVHWAVQLEEEALLEIVRALHPESYGQCEIMNLPDCLIIMRKGLASAKVHFLVRGDIWGQGDILLETPELKERVMPRALSFVEVLVLTKEALKGVCKVFPQADHCIRRAQVRMAVRRAFILAAVREKHELEKQRGWLAKPSTRSFNDSFMSEPDSSATVEQRSVILDGAARRSQVSHSGSFSTTRGRTMITQRASRVETEGESAELKSMLMQLLAGQEELAQQLRAAPHSPTGQRSPAGRSTSTPR